MWLFILGLYTLKKGSGKDREKNENKSRIGINCFSLYTRSASIYFFIPVGYQQEVTLNNALILSLVV